MKPLQPPENLDGRICCEEKIFIHSYRTAKALKNKIRRIMAKYETAGWNILKISSHGSFLLLRFQQSVELQNDKIN